MEDDSLRMIAESTVDDLAAYETAEAYQLARAVLRLLTERDELARYKAAVEAALRFWDEIDDSETRDAAYDMRIAIEEELRKLSADPPDPKA